MFIIVYGFFFFFFYPFAVSPLQETHFVLSPPLALFSLSLSLWGKIEILKYSCK